jgi:hypothetical protein
MGPVVPNVIGSWWKLDPKLLSPTAAIQKPFLIYKQKRQRPPQELQYRPQ